MNIELVRLIQQHKPVYGEIPSVSAIDKKILEFVEILMVRIDQLESRIEQLEEGETKRPRL